MNDIFWRVKKKIFITNNEIGTYELIGVTNPPTNFHFTECTRKRTAVRVNKHLLKTTHFSKVNFPAKINTLGTGLR